MTIDDRRLLRRDPGLNLGGGKAVIVGDNKIADRELVFRAHGRFVETLHGRYITAEDIGTSPADMEFVKRETNHVAGPAGGGRNRGDRSGSGRHL